MSSLEWTYGTNNAIWRAKSVEGSIWQIRCNDIGMFCLIDTTRLPYSATPFETLRSAQAWCEEREAELIEERPARRLAKLYERKECAQYWVYDSESRVPPSSPIWKEVGSAWITEGEFTDD